MVGPGKKRQIHILARLDANEYGAATVPRPTWTSRLGNLGY